MWGTFLAVLSVLPSVVAGQSNGRKPADSVLQFEDFRVPTPIAHREDNPVIDRPRYPQETRKQFELRLVKEAKKGPNFAGHYTVVTWSCGSPCSTMAIVDVQTGATFDLPFVGVLGWGSCQGGPDYGGDLLSYRIDSSLLIITGSLEVLDPKDRMAHEGPCRRFYYQWDRNRLNLLRTVIPIQAHLSK